MDESWLNKRVRIVNVDGTVWHGLPIKTGHPEHVDKEGTIVGPVADDPEWDPVPEIRLDDGSTVLGCECWWAPVGWEIGEEDQKNGCADY